LNTTLSVYILIVRKKIFSDGVTELDKRLTAYDNLCSIFGFITKFSSQLLSETSADIFISTFKDNIDTIIFPNVYISLRLYLTLPVSNCEVERTNSKLKLIENAR
ncbi:zinc finger MYM-type protein 1-like, partial [Aphis craccivora]